MLDRYALLLGAMKSGTTALFQTLSKHPDVLGSENKEPAFWIRDGAQARGLEAYRGLWSPDEKPSASWRMEASTAYTKLPVCCSPAARLRHLSAEFRFIYVVRNPVDRIRSHYEHALTEGWIDKPITQGIDPTVLWFSNYHAQLKPFVDCFGLERIHVLSYEELCTHPEEVLADICRFLEIESGSLSARLNPANTSDMYRRRRFQDRQRRQVGPAGTRSDARLQAQLTAESTPSEEHILEIHAALDEDLAKFEETFGINPWTGQRSSSTQGLASTQPAA